MNIGERIYIKRSEKGLSLQKVGDFLGVARQTIQKYENGVITSIPSDKIELLAEILDTTPQFLMGWDSMNEISNLSEEVQTHISYFKQLNTENKSYIKLRTVELVEQQKAETPTNKKTAKIISFSEITKVDSFDTRVSAGTGNEMYGDARCEKIEYENVPHGTDHAVIVDGRSMEPRYSDGQVVFIKEQSSLEIGQIGVFMVDDKAVIKKYGGDRLISLNKDYEDILLEGVECRCIGRVLN